MTTKPAPGEVLFHMADDTEYATLHADDFRKGMLDRDHAIADLTRERDELRAKNEELHRLYAEALARGDEERRAAEDELRAEVERLEQGIAGAATQITELDAENARLRAALEKWRPAIERGRDWYEKTGNEREAKGFAAMLSDFDAALGKSNCC